MINSSIRGAAFFSVCATFATPAFASPVPPLAPTSTSVVGVGAGTSAAATPPVSPQFGQSVPQTGSNFVSMAAGASHSLSLDGYGAVTAWGRSSEGQCTVPAGVYKAISAGGLFSLAIKSDNTLAGWGANGAGQTTVPAGTYTSVSAGFSHGAAIKSDGTLALWGANANGQTTAQTGTFLAVAAGGYHTIAIKADGTLKGWGQNANGQTTVPAGTYTAIAAGLYHSVALKADGTMSAWGAGSTSTVSGNSYGQSMIPGDAGSFIAISAGKAHTLGLRADGTVVAYGLSSATVGMPAVGTDPNYGQAIIPANTVGYTYTGIAAGGSQSLLLRAGSVTVVHSGVINGRYTTIQPAIDAAASNDAIYIPAGNFNETPTVPTSGLSISVAAAAYSGASGTAPLTFTLATGVLNTTLAGAGNVNATGNVSANNLAGNAGINTLNGLAGDDNLTSNAGADAVDGGTGIDTANYAITYVNAISGSTTLTVDSDSVVNVEKLAFSDATVAIVGRGGSEFTTLNLALAGTTTEKLWGVLAITSTTTGFTNQATLDAITGRFVTTGSTITVDTTGMTSTQLDAVAHNQTTAAVVSYPPVQVVSGGSPSGYFNTIQAGITFATAGDTINVSSGTYVEALTVAKTLTLNGPNVGKSGTDATRGAEAIVRIPSFTTSFATAPAVSTYTTDVTVAGGSSAWNATGWDASTGAWQLTAAPAANSFATFNVSSPSTSLGNAYARGTARYTASSNVPSAGQNISPVFVFYVSINGAYDSTITIGGIGGTYNLDPTNPSDWGTPLRNRQAFGFHLGASAGGAIVQVQGNRSGLPAGFAVLGGSTTWDQLMAATTASGATWSSLPLGAISIACAYAPGYHDPATAANSTSVLVKEFTVVPTPGAVDTATYNSDANKLVNVTGTNVSIKGFYFDGDNSAATSTYSSNGANPDADVAIYASATANGLLISNNIIKNALNYGVLLDGGAGSTSVFGEISNNKLDNNVSVAPITAAIKALLNFYAKIEGNTITNSYMGVETYGFNLVKSGAGVPSISNNTITMQTSVISGGSPYGGTYTGVNGISFHYHSAAASSWTIANNTVTNTNVLSHS